MPFLKLPRTVIERILNDLPMADLSSCLLVNKYLNEITTTSMNLLNLELSRMGAVINPFSSFSSSECLRILNESTKNWSTLTPEFIYSVNIPRGTGRILNKEGVLICLRWNGTGLWYMPLARNKEESVNATPVWHSVNLGVHYLITINLCLYEHDLLTLITSTLDLAEQNATPEFSIHILLRRFSIQGPHPRASISDIFVMKSPVQKPRAVVHVVGRHLVVMVHLREQAYDNLRGTYIYVYNWKTGALLMEFTAPIYSYESVVFLDEHLILIPNAYPPDSEGRLDIFRIPAEPNGNTKPAPIMALQLPTLRQGSRYTGATSHHETNPIAKDSWSEMHRRYSEVTSRPHQYMPYGRPTKGAAKRSIPLEFDTFYSQRPFIMQGEDALCHFTLVTATLLLVQASNGMVLPTRRINEQFMMLVHRKALLRAVEQYAPKPTTSSSHPTWESSWLTVEDPSWHSATTPSLLFTDASGIIFPQENIAGQTQVPFSPHTAPNFRVAHRTPVPAISVAWAQWGGPLVTRWLKLDTTGMRQFGLSVGERCVRFAYGIRPPNDPTGAGAVRIPAPYHMLDFNNHLNHIFWDIVLHSAAAAEESPKATHRVRQSGPSGPDIERSGTDEPVERIDDASVDLNGGGKNSMDNDGNGQMNLSPAIVPANAGSEAIASDPNDPALAVNPSSHGAANIPKSRDGERYDNAEFIEQFQDQTRVVEAQHEDYTGVDELADIMRQNNTLESPEFMPPLECELPFTFMLSDTTVNWEAIMMDEERIMGLCNNGTIQSVEIHHFG